MIKEAAVSSPHSAGSRVGLKDRVPPSLLGQCLEDSCLGLAHLQGPICPSPPKQLISYPMGRRGVRRVEGQNLFGEDGRQRAGRAIWPHCHPATFSDLGWGLASRRPEFTGR